MINKSAPDLDACYYQNNSQAQFDRANELLLYHSFRINATVLDVGCGDGKITAKIASLVPEGKVLGIDASPNMIHLANNTFQQPNLEFRCVKAEEIPLTDLFDDIVCFSCLTWVREPAQALIRLSKLLKPRGRLLILTYLKEESAYVDLLEKTLESYPKYKNLSAIRTMLSQQEHHNILEANGLDIQTREVRDLISSYASKDELKNYLKGWLRCYVPICEKDQDQFLEQVIQNSAMFSIQDDKPSIKFSFKSLVIKAMNRR